jgi:hypothetical protein
VIETKELPKINKELSNQRHLELPLEVMTGDWHSENINLIDPKIFKKVTQTGYVP